MRTVGRDPTFNNFERIAAEPQKAEIGFSLSERAMNFVRHELQNGDPDPERTSRMISQNLLVRTVMQRTLQTNCVTSDVAQRVANRP
jgi:hypothetical protein